MRDLTISLKVAEEYGMPEAILLSTLISLLTTKKIEMIDDKEFFHAHQSEIEQISRLSVDRQRRTISKLREGNLIITKIKGIPARNFYHINFKKYYSLIGE